MAQELIIEEKVKLLALGDSYTIGESVPPNDRWPTQLIDSLKKRGLDCFDPKIIATTGWRTDNLKNAITNSNLKPEYNLVSLLIGVNNFYQGKSVESYKPEFEELLAIAIHLADGVKEHVFVVSIPDYGYTPFGESNQFTISQGMDSFNAVNEAIAKKLGVPYFYITDISRRGVAEPDLVAVDGLHPSGKMYSEWVEVIVRGATIQKKEIVTDVKKKNEESRLWIHPNPFHHHLIIENIPATERQISIQFYDSKGVVALNETLPPADNTIRLDTEKLSTGTYLYKLSGHRLVQEGKLIKN